MYLEANIKGICGKFGLDFSDFLVDLEVDHVKEIGLFDLEIIAEEYGLDVQALVFKPCFKTPELQEKCDRIKLLILDVDGVMTDGGMYFTESGDQFKKFNTKDGMAIIHLTKNDFQIGIISSGFKGEAVKQRAEMLGIQNCYVGRGAKIDVLNDLCKNLAITLDEVAMIGDDINDVEVMRQIGLSFCPADAVDVVKNEVDIILNKNGGAGCVRELIDGYLLPAPLNR